MLLFRALVGAAMAAYVVAVPTDSLEAVARVWMWYARVDGVAALLSIAILPPGYARGTSLRLQAVWSIGAAVIGIFIPPGLLLLLFVLVPLWSIGHAVLAVAGLQQIRTPIEARWLIAIVGLAAAAFAAVSLGTPAGETTWLRATLAASGAASSVAFLLAALSVKAAPHYRQ